MIQTKPPFFGDAEPAWSIAELYPPQGEWTEEEYLALETNRLIEYSHGSVEVLEMPSVIHQFLVRTLFKLLERHVQRHGLGQVFFAPVSVQLWPRKYREPDIIFVSAKAVDWLTPQYIRGADLVMEVISPGDRKRDEVDKRREYAQAAIPEYWLIDPERRTVTVLTLDGRRYAEHGVFGEGDHAPSLLLPGFSVDVTALFAEAQA